MQPVPAAGGVLDPEQLQDSDEHVGVVIRQRARQQAVAVVQLDVEAATKHGTLNTHVRSDNTADSEKYKTRRRYR